MEKKELEKRIIDMLKTCYDPEIPVDVYELGLIYEIRLNAPETPAAVPGNSAESKEDSNGLEAEIVMTLTSPNCPVAESLPLEVENKVRTVEGVKSARVTLTFDPPWDKTMMSEEAQVELGFM